MHKSSPFTSFFKVIFPVFMIMGFIFGIYLSWTQGPPESQGFTKAMIIGGAWVSIFLVQLPFRLKSIEASEKGIIIKEFGKEVSVNYQDIHWIAKFDFTCPWFITIKYHNTETGKAKKISFMPNHPGKGFLVNDAMTLYIKEKIASNNPNYTETSQPSDIKNFMMLMVLAIPVVILCFYYMSETIVVFGQ